MAKNQARRADRDRLDHILPQGYPDGFTDPAVEGQLSIFDLKRERWFESGTARVGAQRGYYDYSRGGTPDQTADEAFDKLETDLPPRRDELIARNFANWREHLDLILSFAQMLRARSEFYREQTLRDADSQVYAIVTETGYSLDLAAGKLIPMIKHTPHKTGLSREFARNKAITDMRHEIAKGADWLLNLNWCLKLTADPEDPVVACHMPLGVECNGSTTGFDAIYAHDSTTLFPLCWRACLLGSKRPFAEDVSFFDPAHLQRVRSHQFQQSNHFVYSPRRLSEAKYAASA